MKGQDFTSHTRKIAIDFDGCICENAWPEIGAPNWDIIKEIKALRESGACLILWTCREGNSLKEAVEACRDWGLEFDAVNENPRFFIDQWGTDPRKVGADEYWDDRSVYVTAKRVPKVRNLHGKTVKMQSHERIREFINQTLEATIREAMRGGAGCQIWPVLIGCRDYLEQLLDEAMALTKRGDTNAQD